jgi:hypothetical protein
MGVLETATRIVELGGAQPSRSPQIVQRRALFEALTGAFTPEDEWFEERSRAFWCDAITRGRLGREVEAELAAGDRAWLGPLERAHRGLFRMRGGVLVDVWSGAEIVVTLMDEESRAELDASAGQLMDARVVGADDPLVIALLTGAVFHPPDATAAIESVLQAARARSLSTHETLDALLRMQRSLRALSRVKTGYAYRPEALSPPVPPATPVPVRRSAKAPT